MSRISPLTGLRSLKSVVAAAPASPRAPFAVAARAISTSTPASSRRTEWVRGKLWKDKAPGPEDPYTERPKPEDIESNLPIEATEARPETDLVQPAARNSPLVFPNKRTEAKTAEEIAKLDPTYEPASKMDELEVIKPLSSWWNQPGHWGPESKYVGFANAGNKADARDRAIVEVYVRRALVETLALRKNATRAHVKTQRWRQGNRDDLTRALAVGVVVGEDGKPVLDGHYGPVARSLNAANDKGERAEVISKAEAAEMVKAWDASWKNAVLDDELRFTIRKRLYQFTGNYLPDAKLGAAGTVKDFLALATKQPAPKKLADAVRARVDLKELPNMKLHDRRVSTKQKEMALGRWKLIEAELEKRDLPVKGTAGFNRNKELDWILGKQ